MTTKSVGARASAMKEYAVHKTRGLAYARLDDQAEWEKVDINTIGDLAELERTSHARIGEYWFTVYRGPASS